MIRFLMMMRCTCGLKEKFDKLFYRQIDIDVESELHSIDYGIYT